MLLTWPVVAALTLLTVLLLAAVARQLLGIRFGIVRTLLAGVLAFAASGPLFQAMAGATESEDSGLARFWFMLLAIAISLLAAMVFLVLAEALVPAGSIPPPYEWRRALRGRLRRTRRYAQIVRIALRHGLGRALRGRWWGGPGPEGRARAARSLRLALDEGGVTFVKLGQLLSTRRDLLPAEFVAELGRLQDRAVPAPWPAVEAVLAAELGRPVGEVFAAVDPEPLAAASIAQVHAARLVGGEEVVLKVQRPGIRPVVEQDLDIVHRLARTLSAGTIWGRTMGVRELAAGFAAALRDELDFRVEAATMAAAAEAAGGRDGVRIPPPHRALCSERLLVMERLDGVPLAAAGPALDERGLDRHALAATLLDALLRQMVLDGLFHADPHPGNVLLLADGGLALLDFGSVGRLDITLRAALRQLLLALDRADPVAVSDALLEVVPRPDEIDEQRLERAVGVVLARHLGPGGTGGLRLVADLVRVVAGFGLAVPPEIAAVFRALATAEGTLTQLAPGFDLVAAPATARMSSPRCRRACRTPARPRPCPSPASAWRCCWPGWRSLSARSAAGPGGKADSRPVGSGGKPPDPAGHLRRAQMPDSASSTTRLARNAVTSAESYAGATSTTSTPTSGSSSAQRRTASSSCREVSPPGSGVPVPGAMPGSTTSTSTDRKTPSQSSVAMPKASVRHSSSPRATTSVISYDRKPCSAIQASVSGPGQ